MTCGEEGNPSLQTCPKLTLAIVPYAAIPLQKLRDYAERINFGPLRIKGKSDARYLAHLAGRTALACVFDRIKLNAFVEPNKDYGYLQVVTSQRKEIAHIFANISHTDGVAIGAVASCPIGVDVESTNRNVERVLRRVAHKSELAGQPKIALAVEGYAVPLGIALWSAKEAASKAIGLGIKFGLSDFVIGLDGKSPYSVTMRRTGPLLLDNPAVVFTCFRNFIIAVCTEKRDLGRSWDSFVVHTL